MVNALWLCVGSQLASRASHRIDFIGNQALGHMRENRHGGIYLNQLYCDGLGARRLKSLFT